MTCTLAQLAPHSLTLRPARTNAILGTQLTEEEIAGSLRRLGLAVDATQEPLRVTVPTFRPDLVQEIDLIEEVGRMIGYETLPETLPPARGAGWGRRARRTAGHPPPLGPDRAGPVRSDDAFSVRAFAL